MKPIGKYIVISQVKEEVKTESGLLLSAADALDIRYKKGKVIAPGTDVSVIDSEDVIFYDSRAGYAMLCLLMSGDALRCLAWLCW